MLFSATLPKEVHEIAKKHMEHDRLSFNLSQDELTVDEVDQYYVMVEKNRKISALVDITNWDKQSKTLVFCRTKRTVDWLVNQLKRRKVNALPLHGDKRQRARNAILNKFKENGGVLVATNVVARGIHIEDIDYVVNFDLPQEAETYVHRIGRTARQGKDGLAITFCTNAMELQDLERMCDKANTQIYDLESA